MIYIYIYWNSRVYIFLRQGVYILILFGQFECPKKCSQKALVTFLLFIFHIKLNEYSLRIVKNENLFKRHKYTSPHALTIK